MSNKGKKNWPQGFTILILGEMWDRLTFYAFANALVPYLVKFFHFPFIKAYDFWGTFIAFGFMLPVFGGIVADRVLGLLNAIFLGAILLISGNLLLAIYDSSTSLAIGMSLVLLGIGLFKGSISACFGNLFKQDAQARDQGFTLFFMGMTLGTLIAPIYFALISRHLNADMSFLILSLGMTIITVAMWLIIPKQADTKPQYQLSRTGWVLFYMSLGFVILGCSYLMKHPHLANRCLAIFIICVTIWLIGYAWTHPKSESQPTMGIIILGLLTTVFYIGILQVHGPIIMFVDEYMDTEIWDWIIPPISFGSLQPLASCLTAPILAQLWKYLSDNNIKVSSVGKFAVGMLLTGLAFIIFIGVTYFTHSPNFSLLLLVIANLILGLGATCIMPTSLYLVSQYAPKHLASTLMGFIFMMIGLAAYIASNLGHFSHSQGLDNTLSDFTFVFTLLAFALIIVAAVLMILRPYLNRLLTNTQ